MGSKFHTAQTDLSPFHPLYVAPQTQRPTASLSFAQQPSQRVQHGFDTAVNPQSLMPVPPTLSM